MKTATPELTTFLATQRTAHRCDLLTISRAGLPDLLFTDDGQNVTFGSRTWLANAMLFERDRVVSKKGIQVDTLEVRVQFDGRPAEYIDGVSLPEAFVSGRMDGSEWLVERAYFAVGSSVPVGLLYVFGGRLSKPKVKGQVVTLPIKSHMELLNREVPPLLHQVGCNNVLYDFACGKLRSDYTVTGNVAAGATLQVLPSNRTEPDGWFNGGVVQFATGSLIGVRRSVRTYAGGAFTFFDALPSLPTGASTFKAWPTCHRTQVECDTKFGNLPRFRGMPYVPVPETAT